MSVERHHPNRNRILQTEHLVVSRANYPICVKHSKHPNHISHLLVSKYTAAIIVSAEIPGHVLELPVWVYLINTKFVIKQILFAQNHFQDCPQYPLSCEKCGKENIPRDEVSSFVLEMWHIMSDLHLSGTHKCTVLFPCTDWLACRRKVKSFCPTRNLIVI